jgi:hypothetical protein
MKLVTEYGTVPNSMYKKCRGAAICVLIFLPRDLRPGFSFEFLLAESISAFLPPIFNNR